jgi:predicted Zn-dependent protease
MRAVFPVLNCCPALTKASKSSLQIRLKLARIILSQKGSELKPITILENVQKLYDANEFITAYNETKELWQPATVLKEFSVDGLILAARLAVRLGGRRLWRWLFREALSREPDNPKVRYFARYVRRRQWTLLDQICSFPSHAELDTLAPQLRANYLASHAILFAWVRDFGSAHDYIRRAYGAGSDSAWTASCESDIFGLEDKWTDALRCAEEAWQRSSGAPFAASNIGNALLHLGRIEESATRLTRAAAQSQSYEIAQTACWHQCALAETLEGETRIDAAFKARSIAEMLPALAPLADSETRSSFSHAHLDIATLLDDQEEIERWAREVKSPFHRTVLQNLKHAARRTRIRLSYRRPIQKHQACVPTSIASVLSVFGADWDPDRIAHQITFGGTPDWAAAEWLEANGYVVRFFTATPELTRKLIGAGIPYVLTLEGDHNAHAVAVIGVDDGAGTLLVHDPQEFRTGEYLLTYLDSMRSPLGPRAMVAVPAQKAALLGGLLPADDVEVMTAAMRHNQALQQGRPSAAREIVRLLSGRYPDHSGIHCLRAFEAVEDGRTGEALQIFQKLYTGFPESALIRSRLISAYRSAGDQALLRSALQRVVEDAVLPGVEARQSWLRPPARYICEYADLLRQSAETARRAEKLLHSVIGREPASAEAWHILADCLWNGKDRDSALLCYRFGSCLDPANEHYAVAYCDALAGIGRKDEGLAWLEQRVRCFGNSSAAIDTWLTWIGALENWGEPERALFACEESLASFPAEAKLLTFAVTLFARMGNWERAADTLERIPDKESPGYLESAVEFHRMKGELDLAISCAERLVAQAPASTDAKRWLLDLTEKRDGSSAALLLAEEWVRSHPGNNNLEHVCLNALDRANAPEAKKYRLLLRRLKRNPEDGWAWRDLTFRFLSDYQSASTQARPKIARRIARSLAECERTSAGEPGTIRAQAEWLESQGEWQPATELWLQSIQSDPTHMYGYRHAIDCSSRFPAPQRAGAWERMRIALLQHQGRWSNARDLLMLGAERFGVTAAEEVAGEWLELRPNDPGVIEAAADLLLVHGHGRSDAQKALDLLLPAVERFPFHFGLRFSLADAYRDLGNSAESEHVLLDLTSRHPENSTVKVRLALIRERQGRRDDALALLDAAAADDPCNYEIAGAKAGILIRGERLSEARAFVLECLQRLPEIVGWRKRAIDLFIDCGDEDGAVAAARRGINVYPGGAYLWLLLGETLYRLSSHAAPGEIEQCFRRSVELNHELFEAADWLSIVLVRQRRYSEAETVMNEIERRMPNPSAAQGRIAWIRRSEEKKAEAVEQMVFAVKASPWYSWGWSMLIEWLEADQAWDKARALLSTASEEQRTNTEFRRRRLMLLEKAAASREKLDEEWNVLLRDFPEDVPLHLQRHDSLCEARRFRDAEAVLDRIGPVAPDSPYVLARCVESHARNSQKEKAIAVLLQIFFMEVEEKPWPANHAWEQIQQRQWADETYEAAVQRIRAGEKPTPRAITLLALHASGMSEYESSRKAVPLLQSLFPGKPARELRRLLGIAGDNSHFGLPYRAILLTRLSDIGQQRLTVRYCKLHREELRDSVECWAQAGRALVDLGRKGEARELFCDWRSRKGVGMWTVTNYVLCFSGRLRNHLEELASTCADALAGLEHDHCAKYLAHRLLHSEALLGRRDDFLKHWQAYRNYFDQKLEKNEYFRAREKYLLDRIHEMGEALEAGRFRDYDKAVRSLQWKRWIGSTELSQPVILGRRWSWWRLAWILLWLLLVLNRFFTDSH